MDLLKTFSYSELLQVNQKFLHLNYTIKHNFFWFCFLNREPGSSQVRQNINREKLINKSFPAHFSLFKENPCSKRILAFRPDVCPLSNFMSCRKLRSFLQNQGAFHFITCEIWLAALWPLQQFLLLTVPLELQAPRPLLCFSLPFHSLVNLCFLKLSFLEYFSMS